MSTCHACHALPADMLSIDVMPLDDAEALPVPREAARGAAHWPRSVWRASDAFALACEARRLCSAKLKQARIHVPSAARGGVAPPRP